jgi:lipoprotein signal peptidase
MIGALNLADVAVSASVAVRVLVMLSERQRFVDRCARESGILASLW